MTPSRSDKGSTQVAVWGGNLAALVPASQVSRRKAQLQRSMCCVVTNVGDDRLGRGFRATSEDDGG